LPSRAEIEACPGRQRARLACATMDSGLHSLVAFSPMDTTLRVRDTCGVLGSGWSRQKLAGTLQAAYADGLLSEQTLSHRLELLLAATIVDPAKLVADLPRSTGRRMFSRVLARLPEWRRRAEGSVLLALDWTGVERELLIGRHRGCDVQLPASTVSRRHARLVFRDGGWIVQDLELLNGTFVNGVPVGRCRLRPGDCLSVADQPLRVD
jgi:hypothetical protein